MLNAILDPQRPIVDVTLENPYNLQDFAEDKLSILDVKAVDQSGAIYDIEMQLTTYEGLVQRIVYYGCKLYTGQLVKGDDYSSLRPVFSILLVDGVLWPDANELHHAFRLTDQKSGRVLEETLEVHTLELGRYNMTEADLRTAGMLDCWLYWFLHAHEYEPEALRNLFPQQPIRQATEAIIRIAQITEDKAMYDAREMARRDQTTAINSAFRRGRLEGKIETLQGILGVPASGEDELRGIDTWISLQAMTTLCRSNCATGRLCSRAQRT